MRSAGTLNGSLQLKTLHDLTTAIPRTLFPLDGSLEIAATLSGIADPTAPRRQRRR